MGWQSANESFNGLTQFLGRLQNRTTTNLKINLMRCWRFDKPFHLVHGLSLRIRGMEPSDSLGPHRLDIAQVLAVFAVVRRSSAGYKGDPVPTDYSPCDATIPPSNSHAGVGMALWLLPLLAS